ncbi:glutathione peroxidase [Ligilactobacillus hayakitensis DSM 18933 = JCM 14209]|uniref:Glutathione peroxidase n=1 Tax=Ligilactobacillus hayakitensis DSM 18933 = JCM 14209 TaxID=1423755 RepID=A0A0R1WYR6_9LACO|nr:glutathione peroxidase [Ligilactobacillus hayakitensis]KRM20070.1 glutathione peroxidase [Ligilactobacillus hayakitensis DSM 18933 = JCM 14209]
MSAYDFTVKDMQNNPVSLNQYEGKALLIVNTATGCGFTPQYEGLEKLYQDYQDQGFVILDFPCNQFGHQAPGSIEDIHNFCTMKYDTTFPQFAKIDVNGKNADPLFNYLKQEEHGILGKDIKWNFTKFLVNKQGEVIKRYAPQAEPEKIAGDIEKIL